jgi:hypothetical protein
MMMEDLEITLGSISQHHSAIFIYEIFIKENSSSSPTKPKRDLHGSPKIAASSAACRL